LTSSITVVGSYNTGFVLYVDRLPLKGETVPAHGFRVEHGGKGSNQAIQAARLGCETKIVARLGRDVFGERALRKWGEENIGAEHVAIDEHRPTGVGVVIVGPNGQNIIVVDLGANMALSITDIKRASELLEKSDACLAQLEIPFETALQALNICQGVKILNPAPARKIQPSELEGIDIITPNEVELAAMAGNAIGGSIDLKQLAEKYAKYVNHVVVTLGERGALLVSMGKTKYVKTPKINAVDTTGAGDAFNGALATYIAKGFDVEEAVQRACYCGAFLASRIKGGELVESLPTESELEKFISEHGVE
jgi:ribokinase